MSAAKWRGPRLPASKFAGLRCATAQRLLSDAAWAHAYTLRNLFFEPAASTSFRVHDGANAGATPWLDEYCRARSRLFMCE